jgi:hypothetical protein
MLESGVGSCLQLKVQRAMTTRRDCCKAQEICCIPSLSYDAKLNRALYSIQLSHNTIKMLAIRKWVSTFPATPSQANETRYLFPNLVL